MGAQNPKLTHMHRIPTDTIHDTSMSGMNRAHFHLVRVYLLQKCVKFGRNYYANRVAALIVRSTPVRERHFKNSRHPRAWYLRVKSLIWLNKKPVTRVPSGTI